ncbi:MAG: hypothetical protein AAB450_01740 [Patescibacteria group bacterium]
MEEEKQPGDHDFRPVYWTPEVVSAIMAIIKAVNPDWGPVAPATPEQTAKALEKAT